MNFPRTVITTIHVPVPLDIRVFTAMLISMIVQTKPAHTMEFVKTASITTSAVVFMDSKVEIVK